MKTIDTEKNLKKIGWQVLAYTILGTGAINYILSFIVFFGFEEGLPFQQKKSYFRFLVSSVWLTQIVMVLGFLLLLYGSVLLILNKFWGRKISMAGICISIFYFFMLIVLDIFIYSYRVPSTYIVIIGSIAVLIWAMMLIKKL